MGDTYVYSDKMREEDFPVTRSTTYTLPAKAVAKAAEAMRGIPINPLYPEDLLSAALSAVPVLGLNRDYLRLLLKLVEREYPGAVTLAAKLRAALDALGADDD